MVGRRARAVADDPRAVLRRGPSRRRSRCSSATRTRGRRRPDARRDPECADSARGAAPAPGAGGGRRLGTPAYRVVTVDDEAAARARVIDGDTAGLLVVDRADERCRPDVRASRPSDGVGRSRRAAHPPGVDRDRHPGPTRARRHPARRAGAAVRAARLLRRPGRPERAARTNPQDASGGEFAIGFVLAIALFMAIILYGQWIAYSVAEEKSSRVMEVILGAATPFELLAGKVLGVGALAITQYVIVVRAGDPSPLLFQDQIAALVFGGAAGRSRLPDGPVDPAAARVRRASSSSASRCTRSLYAGAASLVSRTEDINQIVAPMTLALDGRLHRRRLRRAPASSTRRSSLVVVLSFVPFFSPYLMLSRHGRRRRRARSRSSSRSRCSRHDPARALARRPLLRAPAS